ncbi:MAG: LIC12162 family protein [Candidatus Endonucleobacter sp. (ex Gigantidas childressi)]|nr:LIC12162 family protein [Candidatus Endonucleobacter sp. (ex Gigantidas childressi)]
MILVTTALKESFPKGINDKVLFLGEWCKIYNEKKLWQKFNSKTVGYHWDDRKKLYKDTLYIDTLYEKYLKILSKELNKIHQEQHSLRYWRIVIGFWLRRFIEVLYDRHTTIEKAFAEHKIDETYVLNSEIENTIARDMQDFEYLHSNDDWNHFIYTMLIENKSCSIKKVGSLNINHVNVFSNKNKKGFINNVKKIIIKVSIKMNRLNKITFFASYIEKKALIKLQLSLGQVPALDYLDRISLTSNYNKNIRDDFCIYSGNSDKFEVVLQKIIKIQIPYSYLENYKELQKIALKKYSSRAELIVTAVGYASFDDFKIWMAGRVDEGAKLIVTQHGGHYGTGLFASNQKHEIAISDKYFSWGWKNGIDKVHPMPAIKLLRAIKYNSNGDILMPLMSLPRYSYSLLSMPIAGQILNYIQNQLDFISLLDKSKNNIKLRIYLHEHGWNIENRLIDNGFENEIDSDENLNKKFLKRLSECRLCIATYNATTYLETFANNFPTLLFWDKNHWELNDHAQPYFDKLHEAGILYYDAKLLADKVEEIYQDPMKWWIQSEVQQAKNDFCAQFANIGDNPIIKWHNKLQQLLDE